MRRLFLLCAATLTVVAPLMAASAATTIRGPLKGPTMFCPAPPDTFDVGGSGHGRYTLSIGDDRTVTVTIVVRHLEPNTVYPVFISTLKDLSEGTSECTTTTSLGTFATDASGNAAFTGTTTLDPLSWPAGTFMIQVAVGDIFGSARSAAFLSPPKTVTI